MRNDVAFEILVDGQWIDIVPNDDVMAGNPLTITRGQGDEGAALRPASLTATLNNDDDDYRPTNPESPFYRRAGVNRAMRILVGGVQRCQIEAASWRSYESQDFRRHPRRGSAWTDIEGGGLLRRIAQWTETMRSPFRQVSDACVALNAGVIAYFPCEQDRADTELVGTLPGSTRATFRGGTFDSRTRPPGSAPLMDVAEDAEIAYRLPPSLSGPDDGYQLRWVMRLEELAPDENRIIQWSTSDPLTFWTIFLDSTTGEIILTGEVNSVQIVNSVTTYSDYDWTDWTLITVDAQYSAPNTNVFVNWSNATDTDSGFIAPSFVGSPQAPTRFSFRGGSGELPAGSTIGHIMAVATRSTPSVDLFGTAQREAWYGHAGETTAARFRRLCGLRNVFPGVIGDEAAASTMGPQPVATFAEHLAEIAATEDGLISDGVDELRLDFMLRNARVNQTPALTLQMTDLPRRPPELADDLGVSNIVTVTQRDGPSTTVRDDTSPMGTAAPPTGRGEYFRTVNVNTDDVTGLTLLAGYWLNRGTVDAPRFPQVTIHLEALPAATVAAVLAVDVGHVIVLDDVRENPIRVHVLGYTETIEWPVRHRITFVCAPDDAFNVGALDATLLTARSTTLKAGVTASGTAVTFRSTDLGDAWNQVTPYDVFISGQLNRVTSMGAPVLVSGAYDQAATLVRGTNGVRKPLAAGDAITVPNALRCAL